MVGWLKLNTVPSPSSLGGTSSCWPEVKVWKHHGSVLQYSGELGQRRVGSWQGGTEKSCGLRGARKSCGWQGAASGANNEHLWKKFSWAPVGEIEREALRSSLTGGEHGSALAAAAPHHLPSCLGLPGARNKSWEACKHPCPDKQGFLCCYLSSSWWFCHMEVNPSSVGLFLASYQISI
jgi:hypothetical protein